MCEAPCGISAVLFLFLGTDTGISGNLCRNISGSCAGHGKGTDGSAAFLSAIVRKRKGALMQEKDVIAKEYLQDPHGRNNGRCGKGGCAERQNHLGDGGSPE